MEFAFNIILHAGKYEGVFNDDRRYEQKSSYEVMVEFIMENGKQKNNMVHISE